MSPSSDAAVTPNGGVAFFGPPRYIGVMSCYSTSFERLAEQSSDSILGALNRLHAESGFATQFVQANEAWLREIGLVKATASAIRRSLPHSAHWTVLLEYEIPRRQKRPDIIIIADDLLFIVEYKDGASHADSAAIWQVYDYALDLRDFHVESKDRKIFPILCPSEYPKCDQKFESEAAVPHSVIVTGANQLFEVITSIYGAEHQPTTKRMDRDKWTDSAYRPTLTIIEAAERLYDNHDVREISHSYADNLTRTTDAIIEHAKRAKEKRERSILFVTGVPGAGKTLTGLNAVHDSRLRKNNQPSAIFLSGNGPLVAIVRAALTRSAVSRDGSGTRQEEQRKVEAFIQNVHSFLKYHIQQANEAPHERVVVFDEAQRAWNAPQMLRKWKVEKSEPELLLEVMERCAGWSVLVALVGNGQEIHSGEAGLAEWGRALNARRKHWNVIASRTFLDGTDANAMNRLFDGLTSDNIHQVADESLHLSVSVRSPRAERISEWARCLLNLDVDGAKKNLLQIRDFPIAITRDFDLARAWLRSRSRLDPHHRCGLIASSGGLRLRAHGIEVSTSFTKGYDWGQWFLGGPDDIRSSFALEVAATEFQCQGLELDWTGICWADDLTIGQNREWCIRQFRGNRWMFVRDELTRQYIINKYRVLLTRARQGFCIVVPEGSDSDVTRSKVLLDNTYLFLRSTGINVL